MLSIHRTWSLWRCGVGMWVQRTQDDTEILTWVTEWRMVVLTEMKKRSRGRKENLAWGVVRWSQEVMLGRALGVWVWSSVVLSWRCNMYIVPRAL